MTPAQRHKQREEARAANARASESDNELSGGHYELMLNQLAQQKRALKAIKSMSKRIEAKAELLPEWSGYIEGTLSEDAGVQDQIIGQLLVWSIDVGDFAQALSIGAYMLKHDLALPEQFERETEEVLAEEMAEAWIKSDTPTLTLEQLQTVEALTSKYDMHDEIRAKLYRALGEAEHNAGNDATALEWLRQALALNERVGCKPLFSKLEKQLSE
ncbi:phage terminase small subunit [Rappaport israeli]|uniref:phage terminase small subunit n=1 Tax=Rappaport israeli TaxID=1839807 RepID=UPI000930B3D7|nr:phage terminase small subunit [Rappaport israeli]